MPQALGKRVLLYAPTYRGHVEGAEPPDALDIPKLAEELSDEWVLLIKHHPFVKDRLPVPEGCRQFAFDVSETMPIDELLIAADALVTDYSSVVFEYSLTLRPMCFFAYDLEEYGDWRGFYYPYEEMTPGPMVRTTQEIADWAKTTATVFNDAEVCAFRNKFMSACDGGATRRIVQTIGIA